MQVPEEAGGATAPRAGDGGTCEPSNVSSGNPTWVLCKSTLWS